HRGPGASGAGGRRTAKVSTGWTCQPFLRALAASSRGWKPVDWRCSHPVAFPKVSPYGPQVGFRVGGGCSAVLFCPNLNSVGCRLLDRLTSMTREGGFHALGFEADQPGQGFEASRTSRHLHGLDRQAVRPVAP